MTTLQFKLNRIYDINQNLIFKNSEFFWSEKTKKKYFSLWCHKKWWYLVFSHHYLEKILNNWFFPFLAEFLNLSKATKSKFFLVSCSVLWQFGEIWTTRIKMSKKSFKRRIPKDRFYKSILKIWWQFWSQGKDFSGHITLKKAICKCQEMTKF